MKYLGLTLILLTGACASSELPASGIATSASARTVNLASYRSFSFGDADPPRSGYQVSPHSLEVQQHLTTLVEAALVERGYLKAAKGGDLTVKIASGTAPPTSVTGDRIDSVRGPEGFIGIDVYDNATGAELWQGSAFAEISLETIDDGLLQRGVAHMLSTFPRQGGSGNGTQRVSMLGRSGGFRFAFVLPKDSDFCLGTGGPPRLGFGRTVHLEGYH